MCQVGFGDLGTLLGNTEVEPGGNYPHFFLTDRFLKIPEGGLIQVVGFGQAQIAFVASLERLINPNDGVERV